MILCFLFPFFFFFNDTATTEIYTLSLHDALPIYHREAFWFARSACGRSGGVSCRTSIPPASSRSDPLSFRPADIFAPGRSLLLWKATRRARLLPKCDE